MGGHYPSGGINIGPAMTFGYIAGRHVAGVTASYENVVPEPAERRRLTAGERTAGSTATTLSRGAAVARPPRGTTASQALRRRTSRRAAAW